MSIRNLPSWFRRHLLAAGQDAAQWENPAIDHEAALSRLPRFIADRLRIAIADAGSWYSAGSAAGGLASIPAWLRRAIVSVGSGWAVPVPVPWAYYSNYSLSPLENTVSLDDAIANDQWWVASTATAISLALLEMSAGASDQVAALYTNGSGVGGPPQIYVLPCPAESHSPRWEGQLSGLKVYPTGGPTHVGIIKAFTQINFINFGTQDGYGLSYQVEFDNTLAVTAAGFIFYRLNSFVPTVLGTYGITPAIGSTELDLITMRLTIEPVGTDVNYTVEFRDENSPTPAWTTAISGTDVGSAVAGQLLLPVITHALTGDSAEPVDGLRFEANSNLDGDNAVMVSNQIGVL